MKNILMKLKRLFCLCAVSGSFCRVVIKQQDGSILKTFDNATIVPRTNNMLYIDGKRYQVSSNVFNYDEKTIYVWVGGDF